MAFTSSLEVHASATKTLAELDFRGALWDIPDTHRTARLAKREPSARPSRHRSLYGRARGLTTAADALEILGCHGGSVPKRRLPSFLINGHVLLEAGSVTSALPLGAQASIEHVLISHAHLDHTVGLAFLVDNIQSAQTAAGRNAAVTAASIAPVIDDLHSYCFNNRLWPDFTKLPTPEDRALRLQTLREREPIEFGSLTVVPVPVQHAVPAAGFIIHDGTSGLVFSSDTGPTDDLKVAREFKGIQAIIVETAFPQPAEDRPPSTSRPPCSTARWRRCRTRHSGCTTSSRPTSRKRRKSWSGWAIGFTSSSRTRPTRSDAVPPRRRAALGGARPAYRARRASSASIAGSASRITVPAMRRLSADSLSTVSSRVCQ